MPFSAKLSGLTKEEKRSRIFQTLSVLCFVLAVALVLISLLLTLPQIQRRLAYINDWFIYIEMFIARFDRLAAVFVILLLFGVKAVFPVIPFSVLFIGSGLVFSVPVAVAVNAVGFGVLVTIQYFWAKKFGGGNTHKLILRSKTITRFMDLHGDGNKWMLVILRFIPFVPVGAVSKSYGATDMQYSPYVILSVLGYLPRLISWSIVGTNITKPVTPGFFIPFAVLLIISGISLLLMNLLYKLKS